jgi:protein gp37
MNKTSIEWTDFTWNPIRARLVGASPKARSGTFCTRVSPGCTHCYASTINKRFGNGLEYTVPNLEKIEFFLEPRILYEPLALKKPARIFVGDMFDLFHETIPQEFIAEVLRVALKTPRHTFQFLTKRAVRMLHLVAAAQEHWGVTFPAHMWFGVSVEDQQRADERIPELLATPAAVRFLSVEPQLEAIDLSHYVFDRRAEVRRLVNGPASLNYDQAEYSVGPTVSWVICGGESGPGARPFHLEWAYSMLAQCRSAGVPFFMKQVGSWPMKNCDPLAGYQELPIKDRKGGDPLEWPEALRVREFPAVREVVTA